MEKSTLYLITLALIVVAVLGVAGEYFTYKYYSILSAPAQSAQPVTLSGTTSNTSSTQATQNLSGSSENNLTSFLFQNPMAVGGVDQINHSVLITVPPVTDITSLVPTIQVSDSATISPMSGVAQDFMNPVTYTVTAQNGSTQKYTVTVNVASILKTVEKSITSFKLKQFSPEIDGFIDNSPSFTVYAVVPDGTDLTKLTPTIEVSPGAAVSPASGAVQDFTSPVIYTVTDSYGDTQIYTITVVTESNSG